MTYDPNIGRWLEEDPLGLDAGDVNLYRMEGNNPVNEVDPSGLDSIGPMSPDIEWLDSKVGIGTGYQKGNWFFGWFPIHGFLVLDGKGYGFFEVTTSPTGTGKWRDDDLDVYPNKKPAEGDFYSEVRPFLIDDSRYDVAKFRRSLRKHLKNAQENPGSYIAGVRDCFTMRSTIIRAALEDSRLDKRLPVLDADVYGKPAPGQVPVPPKRPVGPSGSSKYWL